MKIDSLAFISLFLLQGHRNKSFWLPIMQWDICIFSEFLYVQIEVLPIKNRYLYYDHWDKRFFQQTKWQKF